MCNLHTACPNGCRQSPCTNSIISRLGPFQSHESLCYFLSSYPRSDDSTSGTSCDASARSSSSASGVSPTRLAGSSKQACPQAELDEPADKSDEEEVGLVDAVEPACAPIREPRDMENGAVWLGAFRFTRKFHDRHHEAVGWQAACNHVGHKDPTRPACRRARNFSKLGEELALRKLKWWCLQSLNPEVDMRDEHCALPDVPRDCPLPSLVELDSTVLSKRELEFFTP